MVIYSMVNVGRRDDMVPSVLAYGRGVEVE